MAVAPVLSGQAQLRVGRIAEDHRRSELGLRGRSDVSSSHVVGRRHRRELGQRVAASGAPGTGTRRRELNSAARRLAQMMDRSFELALRIGDQLKSVARRNRIASSAPISNQFSSRLIVSKLIFRSWCSVPEGRLSLVTRLGDDEIGTGLSGRAVVAKIGIRGGVSGRGATPLHPVREVKPSPGSIFRQQRILPSPKALPNRFAEGNRPEPISDARIGRSARGRSVEPHPS